MGTKVYKREQKRGSLRPLRGGLVVGWWCNGDGDFGWPVISNAPYAQAKVTKWIGLDRLFVYQVSMIGILGHFNSKGKRRIGASCRTGEVRLIMSSVMNILRFYN